MRSLKGCEKTGTVASGSVPLDRFLAGGRGGPDCGGRHWQPICPPRRHRAGSNSCKPKWPCQSGLYSMPRTMQQPRQPPGPAFRRFHDLNAVCSDYDAASELRQLCEHSSPGKPIQASDDLWRVLVRARELSQRSEGAFDVTVGPLTLLWRNARRTRELPSPASIAAAREKVGYRLMRLDAGRHDRRTAQAGHEDRSGRHRQGLCGGRGDGRNPRLRHHADDGRGGRKHRPRRSAARTIGLAHRHRSAGRRPTAAAISFALRARPPPRPATSGSTPRSPASATRTISIRKPASR